MKKIIAIFAFLAVFSPLVAQEEENERTLFGAGNDYDIGGYGALVMNPTAMDGEFTVVGGIRGAAILDHKFALGAGFYDNWIHSLKADYVDPRTGKSPRLSVNTYMLEFEYFVVPKNLINYSFQLGVGGGIAEFKLEDWDWEGDSDYDPDYGDDWFFALQPQVNLNVNILTWMRATVGVGYSLALDADYTLGTNTYGDSELSYPYGSLTFRFGDF